MVQDTRNLVSEAVGTVRLRRSPTAGCEECVARARPKPLAQLVFAADLVDGLRVADLNDGRIGRAKPAGEVGRHVRIARAQVIRDCICNGHADVACLHDPVDLAGDLAGAGHIGDGLPVGLRPVDHIARACEQIRVCLEIRALLRLDPALRP